MAWGIAGDRMSPGGLRGALLALAAALALLGGSIGAEAACGDPSGLSRSIVSITRYHGENERAGEPDDAGVRGTAWFLSPRLIVTVAHVAKAMRLTASDWRDLEIRSGDTVTKMPARLRGFIGPRGDNIAVLELQTPVRGALPLPIRTEPLVADEPMMSVGYPAGRLRVASGRFVRYGTDGKFTDAALLELSDGNDRLALDHGASGAPVVDCDGRVVSVVSNVIVQTLTFLSQTTRVSTAWNTPNVVSVPAGGLKDSIAPE